MVEFRKDLVGETSSYDRFASVRKPIFDSDATEFRITLWNINYTLENCIKGFERIENNGEDCIKDIEDCIKDLKKRKAFIQVARKIYCCIESNLKVCVSEMSTFVGLSVRQVQYHLKTLRLLGKISRVGGRKFGEWKITDKDYVTGFGG